MIGGNPGDAMSWSTSDVGGEKCPKAGGQSENPQAAGGCRIREPKQGHPTSSGSPVEVRDWQGRGELDEGGEGRRAGLQQQRQNGGVTRKSVPSQCCRRGGAEARGLQVQHYAVQTVPIEVAERGT